MTTVIRGRVWKFGDNINTDVMAPGFAFGKTWEEMSKFILHIHPKFTEEAKPGDIIVAGKNWGCGSSREQAPANLKKLGIAAVVAESFARIYFRNSIAIGFPVLSCPGISQLFDEGDELEIDLETAWVRNLSKGKEIQGEPMSQEMLDILTKGGIIPLLEEKLATEEP